MTSFLARLRSVAARAPDAPALVEAGRPALSYRALIDRVASLAHRLHAAGAGPEDVIAIAMDKSPEWVVAILATWWCGAAWTPLDPSLPRARRQAMIDAADVRLAVTAPRLGRPEALPACVPLSLDEPTTTPAPMHAGPPDALAYVIFTSGSTGAPKGVCVTHAGLVPMLEAQIATFELGPGSRSLWVLSPAFDASVSDVGTALLAGATLHIDRSTTPERLLRVLEQHRITHVDLPPALLSRLAPEDAPPCLRTMIIGGEPCSVDAVRRWAGRVRLVNVYGPTEATVCTSMGVCDAETWDRPLLGLPLPGVRYEVVDGELWIGGAQLARGYLRAPELEAARFVERRGQRMYRTGDRVRRTAGGELAYLGRADRQVKVGGVLVAPEEVEAKLLGHLRVTRAAVVKRSLGRREALVAFVDSAGVAPSELREHLRESLPASMVPRRIEQLSPLPTTPSGKPDLEALRALPLAAHVPLGGPPATPKERALARLFADALGLDAVGRDDDFFALGGDSLGLVEVIAGAAARRLALGPELIRQHPTIRELATALDRGATSTMEVASLRSAARPGPTLDSLIEAARSRPLPDFPARHIVLTGATGLLGSRLLASLRGSSDARITCLVRDPARLEVLGAELVVSDLSRARLGVSDATWERLSQADAILHCAAAVSLTASYADLEATNVRGTKELLRLACEGRPKSLHLASTLSVFVSTDRDEGVSLEDDDLSQTSQVYGGYAQSKFAAELCVRHAAGALPISIYRLGLLTGGVSTSRHDWLALLVRGLARVGAFPAEVDPELAFDVTPVEHAARSMVQLASMAPTRDLRTFHIAAERPARFAELVSALRAEGIPLEPVSAASFEARLRTGDLLDDVTRLALTRTLAPSRERRAMDMFQATRVRFDDRRTRAAGVLAPSPTAASLRAMVRRMLETS